MPQVLSESEALEASRYSVAAECCVSVRNHDK